MTENVNAGAVIEIITFLAKCWSENPQINVSFNLTSNAKNTINIIPMESLAGNPLDRYRQMRANVWLASTRKRLGSKNFSNDHAFGFVLGILETRYTQLVGLVQWPGMANEIIFNYTYQWMYRPLLDSIYGKPRILEALLQNYMFGDIKGNITERRLELVKKATRLAKKTVERAINENTDVLYNAVPQILDILELDPITTIPIAFPFSKKDIPINKDDLKKSIAKIESTIGLPKGVTYAEQTNDSIKGEYESLFGKSSIVEVIQDGISIPPYDNVDESIIYDQELITRLRMKFRNWKTSWKETLKNTGEEFDIESFIESGPVNPFLADARIETNANIMILLDHSSSISTIQTQYKKATLALCKVLADNNAKFSVYAFSTFAKSVVCWQIKSTSNKWDVICAKRLAQISANGSTPLAQIYDLMKPVLDIEKPEIFLTITDGEPSNTQSVQEFITSMRRHGTRMVALGLGSSVMRSMAIADNLKKLGFERVLAASRLNDIPSKVLGIIG